MSLTMIASPRAATQPAIPCPSFNRNLRSEGRLPLKATAISSSPFSRKSSDPASAFMTSWIMSMV